MNNFNLKKWMFGLTFSAGFLNATALLQYLHVITHHTGTLTQASIKLINGEFSIFIFLLGVLISYASGATMSGLLFPVEIFAPRKRYSGILLSCGIGLLILLLLKIPEHWLLCYLSFMSGIENGMFVYYKGMVLRTTHMTGSLTDIGLALGRWIRIKDDRYLFRFMFQLCHLLAFFLGAMIATALLQFVTFNLLYIVIVLDILLGLDYLMIYRLDIKR